MHPFYLIKQDSGVYLQDSKNNVFSEYTSFLN